MRVLLTGGTGFVGSELARTLLLSPQLKSLDLLVRPQAGMPAAARLAKLRDYWGRYLAVPSAAQMAKVRLIEQELTAKDFKPLPVDINYVLHAAASTDLGLPLAESRRANLYATQKVLAAARRLPQLRRFVHYSTAYVSGKRRGEIAEGDRLTTTDYHNYYEQSKAEAEACVRASDLPFTILRPSIIVGRSDNGYVYRMKVLYSVWRMWLSGVIPRAPLDPRSWLDIVPIDYVVNASLSLMTNPRAEGLVLHLCAGTDRQSPMSIVAAATRVFGVPTPPLSPPWVVDFLRLPLVARFLPHGMREALERMHTHVPYIGMRDRLYSTQMATSLLAAAGAEKCPVFADYGATLFRFCKDSAWGKRPLAMPEVAPAATGEAACSA